MIRSNKINQSEMDEVDELTQLLLIFIKDNSDKFNNSRNTLMSFANTLAFVGSNTLDYQDEDEDEEEILSGDILVRVRYHNVEVILKTLSINKKILH